MAVAVVRGAVVGGLVVGGPCLVLHLCLGLGVDDGLCFCCGDVSGFHSGDGLCLDLSCGSVRLLVLGCGLDVGVDHGFVAGHGLGVGDVDLLVLGFGDHFGAHVRNHGGLYHSAHLCLYQCGRYQVGFGNCFVTGCLEEKYSA